jgi:hypothetical protein
VWWRWRPRQGLPRVACALLRHAADTGQLTPTDTTADDVRTALANDPTASCVVLLGDAGRPKWTIDRNRFLLAVTGPYGHALHARRTAARLADKPRVIPVGATVFDLLDVLSGSARSRSNDDVVVVDAAFRCLGVHTGLRRGLRAQLPRDVPAARAAEDARQDDLRIELGGR